jgi:RHS repeat-associated protein
MPTDIGFTGQRLDAGTGGLMYYGARYYLPGLSRFASADTIVPGAGNPQALNRFSYTFNNPVKYTDPSGHVADPCGVFCNIPNIIWTWATQALGLPSELDISERGKANEILVQASCGVLGGICKVENGVLQATTIGDIQKASAATFGIVAIPGAEQLVLPGFEDLVGPGGGQNIGSGRAYSVAFEAKLPQGAYPGRSRAFHYQEANRTLVNAIDADPEFAKGMDELIPGVRQQLVGSKGGIATTPPKGWTWHHAGEEGIMQLVPTRQHQAPELRELFHPGGKGGYAIWGE